MTSVTFPKTERNTFKLPSLVNTLIQCLYFIIGWETYLSIRSPRDTVRIRQHRLFETLRKLKHKQYIILELLFRSQDIQEFEYLENERSFSDEIKSIFIVFEGLSFGEK